MRVTFSPGLSSCYLKVKKKKKTSKKVKGHPLVVQDPGGGPAFKLLLLQDALEVLHPLLQVPHVGRQVAVQEAERVSENRHPGTDASFVPLSETEDRGASSYLS